MNDSKKLVPNLRIVLRAWHQCLDVAKNGCEACSQLVTGVGDKIRAHDVCRIFDGSVMNLHGKPAVTVAPEGPGKHGRSGLKMSFAGGNLEFGCTRLSVGKRSLDRIENRRCAKTVRIVTVFQSATQACPLLRCNG